MWDFDILQFMSYQSTFYHEASTRRFSSQHTSFSANTHRLAVGVSEYSSWPSVNMVPYRKERSSLSGWWMATWAFTASAKQESNMVWRDESTGNQETNGLPTYFYICNLVWMLCNHDPLVGPFDHRRVRMMVADGLVPIWRQCVCNHSDDGSPLRVSIVSQRHYRTAEINAAWKSDDHKYHCR